MCSNMLILSLDRELMPPGLGREGGTLHGGTALKPSPFLCEIDGRMLVPSVLAFAAREYRDGGMIGAESFLLLELDGSDAALRVARAKLAFADCCCAVAGVWLEVGDEFDRRVWRATVDFMSELCASCVVILFVSAMQHPCVEKLVQELSARIPGLRRSFSWRYDDTQLTKLACAYIKAMGVDIREEDRFVASLQVRLAGRCTNSSGAIMIADILARHAAADEDNGVPYVSPLTLRRVLNT